MYCTYSFEDARFGTIEVLEKINSRGISIRVHEDGTLRITVRSGIRIEDIKQYINNEAEWIEKSKAKMLKRGKKTTIFTPDNPFSIMGYNLQMLPTSPDRRVHISVKPKIISVVYPPNIDPSTNEVVQELVRKGIAHVLKVEGQKVLPQRVEYLAQRNGFRYNGLTLKNIKSMWGSCSNNKHIMLNVQLMRLPQHLIDHVILHELCHTIEMNHSAKFYALLDKVEDGKAKQHNEEMKQWKTQLW